MVGVYEGELGLGGLRQVGNRHYRPTNIQEQLDLFHCLGCGWQMTKAPTPDLIGDYFHFFRKIRQFSDSEPESGYWFLSGKGMAPWLGNEVILILQ